MLLDLDYGIYFYVIFFNFVFGGVCIGVGVGLILIDCVIGVVKVYIICVGEGFFFIELSGSLNDQFMEWGGEFGIIIGCQRCCGWFDGVIGCYVVQVNGLDCLVVIKLDVLDELDEIQVCVVYEFNGE